MRVSEYAYVQLRGKVGCGSCVVRAPSTWCRHPYHRRLGPSALDCHFLCKGGTVRKILSFLRLVPKSSDTCVWRARVCCVKNWNCSKKLLHWIGKNLHDVQWNCDQGTKHKTNCISNFIKSRVFVSMFNCTHFSSKPSCWNWGYWVLPVAMASHVSLTHWLR